MEFCSKCKSFMIPKREEDQMILVCTGCDHKVKKFKKNKYKIVQSNKKIEADIIVMEGGSERDAAAEKRYNNDLYGNGIDVSEE